MKSLFVFALLIAGSQAFANGGAKNSWYGEYNYLRCNEDVRIALVRKQISTAYDHYVNHGRYEERLTDGKCYASDAPGWFSEREYLRCYPDVAQTVRSGRGMRSGWHHYRQFGKGEGRALTCPADNNNRPGDNRPGNGGRDDDNRPGNGPGRDDGRGGGRRGNGRN